MTRCGISGFSLIELTIVLTIVGILSAIFLLILPETSTSLTTTSEQILSDVQYCQWLASTQHTRIQLVFESSAYRLSDVDSGSPVLQPALQTDVISLPKGMSLSTSGLSNRAIIFNSLGVPYVDVMTQLNIEARLTLTLRKRSKQIVIFPETGYAALV